MHFVARKLCNEYGYNPETVLPDFEKLVRAGIQSVRRNQRRFTRGIQREAKLVPGPDGLDEPMESSLGSPEAEGGSSRPTGIVAALQELRSFLLPLMVSNSTPTMATSMIREGVFRLTVGVTCAANGLDNFAPVLYESVLGDLGEAVVRFFNVSQRKVLAPLLASAVVLHGIEVAFALQNVLSELIMAAGPDIAEMIEVLNRLEVPSALPPPRSVARRSEKSGPSSPRAERSVSPQPDTPKSLQVSPVVDATPTNGTNTVASTPQLPKVNLASSSQASEGVNYGFPAQPSKPPMLPTISGNMHSPFGSYPAESTPAPAMTPALSQPIGPSMSQPMSQPMSQAIGQSTSTAAPKVEQDQLNAATTLATGFSSGIPTVQAPAQPQQPQQPQQTGVPSVPMMPMAAPPTMLPSLTSLPIRGQWGSMPTMSERRVTIYYNGRHLSLIYSPLKNTPPTIAELIEHSRKTFTIAPDAVVRVRDLLSKRILETQQDLLDSFAQQIVDLELFLPPPMMSIAPPANEIPRFAPVAPLLVRSEQKQQP